LSVVSVNLSLLGFRGCVLIPYILVQMVANKGCIWFFGKWLVEWSWGGEQNKFSSYRPQIWQC